MDSNDVKEYIKQSLFILMDKNEYDKISMEMIADKSGISRRTIYRYFKSKYDILLFCRNEILNLYFEQINSQNEENIDILEQCFNFVCNNSKFLRIVYKNNLIGLAVDMMEEIIRYIFENTLEKNNKIKKSEYFDFYVSYTAGGISRILERYITDKRVHSPKQVLEIYRKVVKIPDLISEFNK